MRSKKLRYIFLAMWLAVQTVPPAAQAYGLYAEEISGEPGSTVTVSILICDLGSGIETDAIGFSLLFDPDVLVFDETDKSDTLTENFTLLDGKEIETGKIKVVGALFGTPVSLNAEGLFLKIKFHTPEGARKNSSLILTDFKDDIASASTIETQFTLLNAAYMLGDADNNQLVELTDAIIALQIVSQIRSAQTSPFILGDTNGDDQVDLSDSILPMQIISGPNS